MSLCRSSREGIIPYTNEFSCRLENPNKYDEFRRKNCEQTHDDKCIDVIYGIKDGKSEIQALRYDKDVWNESDANKHCKSREGNFEKEANMDMKRKRLNCETKYIEDKEYFLAVVSTGDVDRDGDILEPEGLDLSDYNKIVLYRHNVTPGATAEETLPVGHSLWEKVEGNKVKMAIQFHQETNLSKLLHKFYKEGLMEDWSVGFISKEAKPIKDENGEITGRRITEWALYEVSSVPVGANQYTETERNMVTEIQKELNLEDEFILELMEDGKEKDEKTEKKEVKEDMLDELKREIMINSKKLKKIDEIDKKIEKLIEYVESKEADTSYESYLELSDSGDLEDEDSTSQELEIVGESEKDYLLIVEDDNETKTEVENEVNEG